MNIFVGNLLFEATEEDVRRAFAEFGSVESVAIVLDKKGVNSRGFGFVVMPDDQEAQQAIAALNGKELLGRVLNVAVSQPKTKAEKEQAKQKKPKPEIIVESKNVPVFIPRPGSYKGGRRTRRFIEKRAAAGINEPIVLRRRRPENPMRWRKRSEQAKPWQKTTTEAKPWKKTPTEAKPWHKTSKEAKPSAEAKPWHKTVGKPIPWHKAAGKPKPWQKPKRKPGSWKK